MLDQLAALPGVVTLLLRGQTLLLHPFRALYWYEAGMLLLADLHLGKATHFRRAGIAAPVSVETSNTDRLISLLLDFQPRRVVFLGDLFHSDYNRVWDEFAELTQQFGDVSFELVTGNHDILPAAAYHSARLLLHGDRLLAGPFHFTHAPLDPPDDEWYNLAGHVHPGVVLNGGARQRLRLPCFYFGAQGGLLPAFGAFTGLATIDVRPDDQVFVVAGEKVMGVNG